MGKFLSWVTGLLPGWGWAILGIVATAAAWIWIERGEAAEWREKAATAQALAATLETQLDQIQELNRRNLETLAHVRADHDRALADVAADLARARKARMQLTIVRMENARDPDASRPLADVCPVLDRYLDRLYHARSAAAAGGDRDPAGGDAPPGRAAGVRPGSTSAAPRPNGPAGARLPR